MKNSKVLPLHPIDLKSQPHNHRALAWSSDAELAVAADDSVTIYLPAFPFLDPAQPFGLDQDGVANNPAAAAAAEDEHGMGILPANLPANDEGDDDLGSDNEEDDDDEDDGDDDDDGEGYEAGDGDAGNSSVLFGQQRSGQTQAQAQAQAQRQYSDETSRKLWVSYPALHPELNLHVWEAAGKPMPLIRSGPSALEDKGGLFGDGARGMPPVEGGGAGGEPMEGVEGAAQQQQAVEEEVVEDALVQEVNSHPGAGTGVIGGAGSSLNHVVAVEWSPSGLGRNLRPVLAVLTGCGSLAVYGEGGPLPFGSNAKPSRVVGLGKSAVRDLQSWLALWAVGENFVVPGQEEFGYGEFVKAFAWCEELSAGRALLSYMNDLREIVILSVGTTFRKTPDHGLEEAIWNVQEITRMETGGPHGQVDTCDPDYVPSGSSYCLRWSPWAKGEDTWSCLLSYMDRNYVGFKKITIKSPTWSPNEGPHIIKETADWDGRCMHLATDAFLEFENTIWNINSNLVCRGIIATPLLAEPFEINLSTATGPKPNHPTSQCNTTLPPQPINNPITGLVIHPIPLETTAPPLTPLYTAVRLSATATNAQQWIESSHHDPASPPQWLTTIQSLVTRQIPLGQAGREGDLTAEAEEEGEDGILRGPDADDEYNNKNKNKKSADDNEDDSEDEEEEEPDPDADFDPWANEGPDIHPHSMRIWGLARSPGGGSTAILATPLLTQRPMRGAWGAHRSRVLFGWRTRVGEPEVADGSSSTTTNNNNEDHKTTNSTGNAAAAATRTINNLTTEARLWEWMYGGAPGVPGLTPPLEPESLELARRRRHHHHHHQPATPQAHQEQQQQQQLAQDQSAMARRARIREICRPIAASQTCDVCGGGSHSTITPITTTATTNSAGEDEGEGTKDGRVLAVKCSRGHRLAVCGVTGLAIMAPGISRACGVCQSRILGWEYLLERILKPAGVGEEDLAVVKGEMGRASCARCGGKYLD